MLIYLSYLWVQWWEKFKSEDVPIQKLFRFECIEIRKGEVFIYKLFKFQKCLKLFACVFFCGFKCSDSKGMGYFKVFKLEIWSNAVNSQSFFCVKVGIFVIFVNIWWENFKFYRDAHSKVVYTWIFLKFGRKNLCLQFFF